MTRIVLTLDMIRARCEVTLDDCWTWKQGTLSGGQPCARSGGKSNLVRRLSLELSGKAIPPRHKVVDTCENMRCCNPDHLKALNGHNFMMRLNATGKINSPDQDAQRTAAARSRAWVKLDMTKANSIRAAVHAGENRDEVAQRFGICRGHVNKIVAGTFWKPDAPSMASIFTLAQGVAANQQAMQEAA